MNKTLRITIIVVAVLAVIGIALGLRGNTNFREKYEGFDLSSSVGATSATRTYAEYLNEHKNAKNASKSVSVDIFNFDKI